MKHRVIATLTSEGEHNINHTYPTPEEPGQEEVEFVSDLDVDADAANGQNGFPIAYRVDNRGRERLADIGYPRYPDEYSEGLISGPGGPIAFRLAEATHWPDGRECDPVGTLYYASRTALCMPGFANNDPRVGVDAERFAYMVVPPVVRQRTFGKVLGAQAYVSISHDGGQTWSEEVPTVVADIGPKTKDGEGSPALCRALGVSDDPLSGGTEKRCVRYRILPGVPAVVDGFTFALQ